MNLLSFNEAVGTAMRRGDQSEIPEVAQAASSIRPIFEATKVRMQELGILPEDVSVSTAQSYLPRIYKFDKILSDRTEFRGRIATWLRGISYGGAEKATARLEKINAGLDEAAAAQPKAKALADDITASEAWAGREVELKAEISARDKIIKESQDADAIATAKVEREAMLRHSDILDNSKKYKSELRALTKKANSTDRLNASRERNIKNAEPLSREEAEDAADEIVNKIVGAPSGLVPADILPEKIIGRAGFTKSRSLLIPDERIEDFLESDINHVMESYLRQIGPEIELTSKFGSKDMGEQIRQVSEEYSQLIRDAKKPKERAKLEKQREADLRDITRNA